jgi:hypothetical protein
MLSHELQIGVLPLWWRLGCVLSDGLMPRPGALTSQYSSRTKIA